MVATMHGTHNDCLFSVGSVASAAALGHSRQRADRSAMRRLYRKGCVLPLPSAPSLRQPGRTPAALPGAAWAALILHPVPHHGPRMRKPLRIPAACGGIC